MIRWTANKIELIPSELGGEFSNKVKTPLLERESGC